MSLLVASRKEVSIRHGPGVESRSAFPVSVFPLAFALFRPVLAVVVRPWLWVEQWMLKVALRVVVVVLWRVFAVGTAVP